MTGRGRRRTAKPAILSRNFWRSVSATADVSSMMSVGTWWCEMSCASISRAYLRERREKEEGEGAQGRGAYGCSLRHRNTKLTGAGDDIAICSSNVLGEYVHVLIF